MCGIAGLYLSQPLADVSARLTRMTDAIAHRGPDGEGTFIVNAMGNGIVGIGQRRLAIIDVAGGVQPFIDSKTKIVLAYNGELYNYVELRDELKSLGHVFHSASDTEVVLQSYIAWGTNCFARFRGMFALAIWDPRHKQLLLARDHFGKKPLFVRQLDGGLIFGSEPKAILAFGGTAPALDMESVSEFLAWRYVPGPNTLFKGIKKLHPGSWAIWRGDYLEETRYFEPPYSQDAVRSEPSDPIAAFTDCLDESVKLRMASDVPFGAFLSGGIDSSAIVALMSRHASEPVRTFSVGFREAEHSELQYARLIAEKFHTQHTELLVSADDLMSYLPTLIRSSDGPVSEPSNIPIWLISKKASESVKMVLTGEGSDELLGGYPKHSAERFGAIWRSLIPTSLHKNVVEPVLGALPFRFHRVKTLAASIGLRSDEERFARWMGALTFAERDQFMAMHTKHRPIDELVFRHGKGRTALERILQFDQLSWLPDNLLERGDRMTMAASIEARMPFMDTVLAAFVSRLGDRWRIRGLSSKHILRLAMKDILPPEIIYRPKVGFRVPVAEWFRGPMREFMRDHLASRNSVTSGLYRESELMRVLDEHEQGVRNHEKLLWSLLNLELFQRQYGLSTSSTLGNAKPVESLVA